MQARTLPAVIFSAAIIGGGSLCGCTVPGIGGSDGGSVTQNVQQQSGTGTSRVSTTKRVGDEASGYVSVPVSYQEIGDGAWAERASSYTSKLDGSTYYTEYAALGYSLSSYAIVGQTCLKERASNSAYRDVKSSNTTFHGNAALEITSRLDDSLYETTVVFDAGSGTGGTRVLTVIYERDAESELEAVLDSWSATE